MTSTEKKNISKSIGVKQKINNQDFLCWVKKKTTVPNVIKTNYTDMIIVIYSKSNTKKR